VLPIASDYFIVETEDERRYDCVKVVVASTITSLRKLFPRHGVYKEIEGQSFLRLYGKFDKRSAEIMSREVPKMTIVPGPLRKMIPMGQGVYMIAYTDNKSAEQMKEYLTNTLENREILCRMMEKALGIEAKTLKMTAIRDYYWPVGTHYYKPRQYVDEPYGKFLVNAQHPMEGVTVVGEVVSKNHGWIEGALESVERGLRHF
jgi:monoamine oxidase